jgi:hypothetical protein
MSENVPKSSKFDDSILIPPQWIGYPLQAILKKLNQIKRKNKPVVATYYSKGIKEWNSFTVDQKEKIIHGWNIISAEEKEVVIADAHRKKSLSNSLPHSDNWNQDDWARLIHIYTDTRLFEIWKDINTVRLFFMSCHISLGNKNTC